MKIAVINLPALRPTMPLYSIGVVSEIIKKNNAECSVFDLNLEFWDKLWSDSFDSRTLIMPKVMKDEMNINHARESIKKTIANDEYSSAAKVVTCYSHLYEQFYNVRIRFGIVDFPEEVYKEENILRFCSSNNIYRHFFSLSNHDFAQFDLIATPILCRGQLIAACTFAYWVNLTKPVKVILGGSYVNRFFRQFESATYKKLFSHVVIGRGETTIPYLLDKLSNDSHLDFLIDEKTMKGNLFLWKSPEFNTYYDGIDFNNYYNSKPVMPIMSSTSCYYNKCRFCDNSYGKKYTKEAALSGKDIFENMKKIEEQTGIRRFFFIDDCLSPSIVREFCMSIIREKKKFNWYANLRFSQQTSDWDFVKTMSESGCKLIFLGLESYSQKELARMNKGIKKEWILPTIKNMKSCNINVHISIMAGFPGQTKSDYLSTKDFLFKYINLIDFVDVNIFKDTPHCNVYRTRSKADNDQKTLISKRFEELASWVYKNNKAPSLLKKNQIINGFA